MDPSTPADSTNNKTNTGELSHIELTDGHVKPVHVINKSNSCSSSSTSSDSSDGDFFQLDPAELDKPVQPPSGSAQQQSLFTTINAAGHEDMIIQHKAAAAELGGPTQSPQVQAMGRSDVPDPNRIPSSVFARTKSATPMEWSVASNESLFSIHMGNSSFSRDHVFLLGSPMVDSSSPSPAAPPFSPASSMPGSSLPPLSPAGPRSASQIHEVQSVQPQPQPQPQPAPGTTEATNAEAMKDVLRAAAEEHNSEKDKPQGGDQTNNSARLSRQSDGSATSFRSFAFPILTGEGRSGSVKVEVPEQQQSQTDQSEQQQTPKAGSPKAAPAPAPPATEAKGWLSCFSCCPFCR